jgi:hypothetical protein
MQRIGPDAHGRRNLIICWSAIRLHLRVSSGMTTRPCRPRDIRPAAALHGMAQRPATPGFHARCDVREFGDIEPSGDTMAEALAAFWLKINEMLR